MASDAPTQSETWRQFSFVPWIVVPDDVARDHLQGYTLVRYGEAWEYRVFTWDDFLQARRDPAITLQGRTVYFTPLPLADLPRLEALADAERQGARLEELPPPPEAMSDAALAAWLTAGVPPLPLHTLIAQAEAAVTPEGEAAALLEELATRPEGERLGRIFGEACLSLLDVVMHTAAWSLWKQRAKALCPALNLTDLLSLLATRRKEREAAVKAASAATGHAKTGSGTTTHPGHTNGHTAPTGGHPAPHGIALHTKPNGMPYTTVENMMALLDQHPDWQNPAWHLWHDAVRGEFMIGTRPLSDEDVVDTAVWLGATSKMVIGNPDNVTKCLERQCKKDSRDMLSLWLDGLEPWDGKPRLDGWLHDCAGVADTAYGKTLSRLMVVSLVARAYDPGCQYRYVIFLEGAENIGKSKLLRTLASPPWYREISSSLEGKESHILIQGAWLAELSELESLNKTGENRLKSFITMQEDSYVPKFKNYSINVPRRTVFIGSTNEIRGEILKGQTGNTRWLPVVCGATVRPEELERVRDQLFAEAREYYQTHRDTWWQLGEEAEVQAASEREARREKSPFEEKLASWLPEHAMVKGDVRYTWWDQIVEDCLKLLPAQWSDKRIQSDITRALQALHWVRDKERDTRYVTRAQKPDHEGYYASKKPKIEKVRARFWTRPIALDDKEAPPSP